MDPENRPFSRASKKNTPTQYLPPTPTQPHLCLPDHHPRHCPRSSTLTSPCGHLHLSAMGDSSYKGVSASQDSRFTNKHSLLLRKLKFPPSFDTKVDMTKVQLSVIKPWISHRVTELLGFEDDVVLEYAAGMLEEERYPDPRKIQIQLMGFLEGNTAEFMKELWELLASAQESVGGVPKRFVEEKKEELRRNREEGERVVREARERAQRAAEVAGTGEGGRRRSRWDAGAPSASATKEEAADRRPPAYGTGRERQHLPNRDEYRPSRSEWNGRRRDDFNRTDAHRNRDSGWGSRAPPPTREDGSDSRCRDSRRSPSPPPRHRRRSPSPPPRQRERSRSRSVTPDYRAEMRERRQRQRPARDEVGGRDARRTDMQPDSDRERRMDRDDENDGRMRRQPRRGDDRDAEAEKEKELREKLMRAKASRSSHRSD